VSHFTVARKCRPVHPHAEEKKSLSGKSIGRSAIAPATRTAIRHAYMAGDGGLRSVAQQFGVGVETVRRCLSESGRPAGHSIGGEL
jgi:hypothetical protein